MAGGKKEHAVSEAQKTLDARRRMEKQILRQQLRRKRKKIMKESREKSLQENTGRISILQDWATEQLSIAKKMLEKRELKTHIYLLRVLAIELAFEKSLPKGPILVGGKRVFLKKGEMRVLSKAAERDLLEKLHELVHYPTKQREQIVWSMAGRIKESIPKRKQE